MRPGLRFATFVLFWLFLLVNSKAIQPSGKLDFEDTSEESVIKIEKTIPTKISVNSDSIGSPLHVAASLSCGPTGCNATSNNNSVETQILVHVQTKVNFDSPKEKKILENASDVPIMVGYRGSAIHDRHNDDELRRNLPDRFEQRYGSSRDGFTPFRQLHSDSSVTLGPPNRGHLDSSGYPYHDSYRPVINGYRGYSSSTPAPFEPYRPANGLNNYFGSSTSRPLDSNNIHSAMGSKFSDSNRRNYDYNHRDNGIKLQIPYFEQSYNKHYFNEEPPPQTIWLGKGNSHNPVEFRDISRDQWRPVFWSGGVSKYGFSDTSRNYDGGYRRSAVDSGNEQQEYRPSNEGPQCSCRDHRTARYDRSTTASVTRRHTGSHKTSVGFIDDKLSPLN